MNKDEAERSFGIAKDHYNKGDFTAALKFFKISNRLEQSGVTERYIKELEAKISSQNNSSSQKTSNGTTNANGGSSQGGNEGNSASTANYTAEQVADIKKILAKKDFYDILGVTKTATDDEIKKSYRKLALKFHPDKNQAPRAEEAFKKLAQAYDCLSNKDKKQYYDQTGNEDPDQHYRTYTNQYHYDNFSPEDIFDMFFGGMMNPNRMHRRANGHQNHHHNHHGHGGHQGHGGNHAQGGQGRQNQPRGIVYFLQFLPLILLLGSSYLFSMQGEQEAAYSLSYNHRYPIRRNTRRLEIPYFVQPSFARSGYSQLEIARLEEDVEDQTIRYVEGQCRTERTYKDRVINNARRYSGAEQQALLKKAEGLPMANCHEYERIVQKKRSYDNQRRRY